MELNRIIPRLIRFNLWSLFGYSRLKRSYRSKEKNGKIKIVFFVNRANTWNSSREVYRVASANENITSYIAVMPSVKVGGIDKTDKSSIDYIRKSEKGNIIEMYDSENDSYFDIRAIDPDYIFIDIPYDKDSPEDYKIKSLARIAKVCYISYGYTMKKSKLQKSTVRLAVASCASYIFSCNDTMYEYYARHMFLSERINGKRLYNIGYPRFDMYDTVPQSDGSETKTILWLPRWVTSVGKEKRNNEPSFFFELKDKLLDYVAVRSGTKLIARPHPFAFDNYIKHGLMTEAEVEAYKRRIEQADNMELDTDPDYVKSLIGSDILIADFTSMLAEYFVLDRPIIYFGNGDNYPPENIGMYNSFYHVKSWDEAEKVLDALLSGDDPKKEQRHKAVEDFRKKMPHNVAARIVDMIVEDYRKG